MDIAYGIEVLPEDDPYIKTAEVGMSNIVVAGVPGAFLVDTFPFLRYVPAWVPGAGFQRKAKLWRKVAEDMVNKPFIATKHAMVSDSLSIHLPVFICLTSGKWYCDALVYIKSSIESRYQCQH